MFFRPSKAVERAAYEQIYVPTSGQAPHLIVGVKLFDNSLGRFQDILHGIRAIIREVLGEREPLDLVEMTNPISNLVVFYPQ